MSLEESLRNALENNFDKNAGNYFPPIRRGMPDSPYLRTSDNRILEYKFEKVLFSDQSDYQFVQVVDTVDFGPLLILDGFANLAASDTVAYTHTLMNLPHENYKVRAC